MSRKDRKAIEKVNSILWEDARERKNAQSNDEETRRRNEAKQKIDRVKRQDNLGGCFVGGGVVVIVIVLLSFGISRFNATQVQPETAQARKTATAKASVAEVIENKDDAISGSTPLPISESTPTGTPIQSPRLAQPPNVNYASCPLTITSPSDFAEFVTADEIRLQWNSLEGLESQHSYRLTFYTTDNVPIIGLLTKDEFSTKPAGTPAWLYPNGEWIGEIKENGVFKWRVEVIDSNDNVLCQSEFRTFRWGL